MQAIIGISNQINLREQLIPRVASRLGHFHIPFAPYSADKLCTILTNRFLLILAAHLADGWSRYAKRAVFKPDAIELCARTVASRSGDVRRAVLFCRYFLHLATLPADSLIWK